MRLFGNKKRKAVTIAVNCLLGTAVFAGGLLGDAAVAKAEVLAKYENGTKVNSVIIANDKTKPLVFYPVDYSGGTVYDANYPIAGYYDDAADVEKAELIIHGGTFGGVLVFGGASNNGAATSNTVTISGGTFDGSYIYGGYSKKSSASGNTVNISGGTFSKGRLEKIVIAGGNSSEGSGPASGNTVNISGGTFEEGSYIYGGYSKKSSSGNTVTISGGTIKGSIYGGYSSNGAASGNTVTISGGIFEGDSLWLYGGIGMGDVTDNTVNITAGCDLSAVSICGGFERDTGKISGNTLNISALNVKAKKITNFNNLNFSVPKEAVNGNTMLTVINTANIDGTTIKAGVATGSGLKKDDKINLLTAGTLSGEAASMKADLTGTGLVKIDGTVEKVDNSIVLTMNEDAPNPKPDPDPDPKPKKLAEESKSLVETRAGGMALLNTAFDLTTGKGFANAQAAAEAESDAAANDGVTKNTEGVRSKVGFTPYAAIGGANMRYETGSYVDSKGWGANIGFSRIINYQNSRLTLAPFVEYGKASYDSYLENAVNTHGSGDNSFTGIGFMAKNEQKDGLYYEGSVRFGRAKGDYQGDASTYDSKYDTASNYLAFHAGIGKVQKLNDRNSIDYYGKFFYTHQNGDTVNIQSTLGDAGYDFDAINSYRLRLGTRWNQKLSARDVFYAGLAWDYEFDSEARAHYNGMSTPSPSMKGSSGMLELGWKQESTKENPFGVDVGVTGWCGKQRGVQFNAGFSWAF